MSDTEIKEVEAGLETVEEALDSKGDPSAPTRKPASGNSSREKC